eukprot:355982-Chlamydomonas_euryale.AAC.12
MPGGSDGLPLLVPTAAAAAAAAAAASAGPTWSHSSFASPVTHRPDTTLAAYMAHSSRTHACAPDPDSSPPPLLSSAQRSSVAQPCTAMRATSDSTIPGPTSSTSSRSVAASSRRTMRASSGMSRASAVATAATSGRSCVRSTRLSASDASSPAWRANTRRCCGPPGGSALSVDRYVELKNSATSSATAFVPCCMC